MHLFHSNTELILIHEVAVRGSAHQLDVLRNDEEVGYERYHEGLLKKVVQAASRLRVRI